MTNIDQYTKEIDNQIGGNAVSKFTYSEKLSGFVDKYIDSFLPLLKKKYSKQIGSSLNSSQTEKGVQIQKEKKSERSNIISKVMESFRKNPIYFYKNAAIVAISIVIILGVLLQFYPDYKVMSHTSFWKKHENDILEKMAKRTKTSVHNLQEVYRILTNKRNKLMSNIISFIKNLKESGSFSLSKAFSFVHTKISTILNLLKEFIVKGRTTTINTINIQENFFSSGYTIYENNIIVPQGSRRYNKIVKDYKKHLYEMNKMYDEIQAFTNAMNRLHWF